MTAAASDKTTGEAGDTLAAHLEAAVATRLDRAWRHRRRVLHRGHAEDLHRLRESVRQLATAVDLLAAAVEIKPKLVARIRSFARPLGRTRDVDVEAQLARELTETAPVQAAAVLEQVARRLMRRRAKELAIARGRLEQPRVRNTFLALRRVLRRPVRLAFGYRRAADAKVQLIKASEARLHGHPGWHVVLDGASETLAPSVDELLHDLRGAIKEHRDTLDVLGGDPGAIARLASQSRSLGAIHDLGRLFRVARRSAPAAIPAIILALDRAVTEWRDRSRPTFAAGGHAAERYPASAVSVPIRD